MIRLGVNPIGWTNDDWPGLGGDIVRALYDVMGRKMEVLSKQIINRGIGRESQDPGDLDRISMLEKLNEAYASLSILAFAQSIHPLVAYVELCRILGQLSIFTPQRVAASWWRGVTSSWPRGIPVAIQPWNASARSSAVGLLFGRRSVGCVGVVLRSVACVSSRLRWAASSLARRSTCDV